MSAVLSFRSKRRYSIRHDAVMVRIYVRHNGGEYWREIPAENGRQLRERREKAADDIEAAIMQGKPPGEVRCP